MKAQMLRTQQGHVVSTGGGAKGGQGALPASPGGAAEGGPQRCWLPLHTGQLLQRLHLRL